jgi:phosphoribosylformylglycinamidine synthase
MSVKVGVVVFPGTNCERDCLHAFSLAGAEPRLIFHLEESLGEADLVVLPGGFAHGDYLRTGALARFSPVMQAVRRHGEDGGLVLGVCNGFQILCEAGLLPGALRHNAGLKFLCKWVGVRVERADSPFTRRAAAGEELRLPINHFEGNFYCEPEELRRIEERGQVLLRYTDNPNGSVADIAGVCNEQGNVFGLMPHPERACEPALGCTDGLQIIGSALDSAGLSRAVLA